jgi:hypothetical protein
MRALTQSALQLAWRGRNILSAQWSEEPISILFSRSTMLTKGPGLKFLPALLRGYGVTVGRFGVSTLNTYSPGESPCNRSVTPHGRAADVKWHDSKQG